MIENGGRNQICNRRVWFQKVAWSLVPCRQDTIGTLPLVPSTFNFLTHNGNPAVFYVLMWRCQVQPQPVGLNTVASSSYLIWPMGKAYKYIHVGLGEQGGDKSMVGYKSQKLWRTSIKSRGPYKYIMFVATHNSVYGACGANEWRIQVEWQAWSELKQKMFCCLPYLVFHVFHDIHICR